MDAKLADSNSSAAKKAVRISNVKSYLDKPTQELVSWILDKDMFNQAMSDQKIDTAKCPLGAIKKAQVDKGAGVLSQINDLLTTGKKDGAGDVCPFLVDFWTTFERRMLGKTGG